MWDGTASRLPLVRGCCREFLPEHMSILPIPIALRCAPRRSRPAPTRNRSLPRWSAPTCSDCNFIPRNQATSESKFWRISVPSETLAKRIIACLDVHAGRDETLAKRIIACLDVHAGRVVKGIQFVQLRDAGDPAELAAAHSEAGADEVVFLDITATAETRNTLLETVRRTARQLFIPFTVGGGIRSLDDAAAVLDCGADKVAINSAAIADPTLITKIAERYGSQAVVVAIDARQSGDAWEVYVW